MFKKYIMFLMILISPVESLAIEKNSRGGFIDFNIYPYLSDVDNDNTITINASAKLPGRFSYSSLLNIGNQTGRDELEDTTVYYTEQNVRWMVSEESPIDLTMQMNFRSWVDNDRHRLGFRWRLNDTDKFNDFFNAINLSWSINFHVLQFDNDSRHVSQMEHVYRMTFPWLSHRIYLSGFIDHTFNESLSSGYPSSPIVAETQIGIRLVDNFFAVAEYRLNEYRRDDVNNLSVGLEYLIKW